MSEFFNFNPQNTPPQGDNDFAARFAQLADAADPTKTVFDVPRKCEFCPGQRLLAKIAAEAQHSAMHQDDLQQGEMAENLNRLLPMIPEFVENIKNNQSTAMLALEIGMINRQQLEMLYAGEISDEELAKQIQQHAREMTFSDDGTRQVAERAASDSAILSGDCAGAQIWEQRICSDKTILAQMACGASQAARAEVYGDDGNDLKPEFVLDPTLRHFAEETWRKYVESLTAPDGGGIIRFTATADGVTREEL